MAIIKPSPRDLLVYIDETGHETFNDVNYPIFGLGGCAALAQHCHAFLDEPWNEMKKRYFGEGISLHASDMYNATNEQKAAISDFFRENLFGRFAAISRTTSVLLSTMSAHRTVCAALTQRLQDMINIFALDSMHIIIEDSQRTNSLIKKNLHLFAQTHDGNPIPIHYGFMQKTANDAGLEVADFIAHTAGAQVASRIRNRKHITRRDFEAVFLKVPRQLTSFIDITAVGTAQTV